MVATKALNLSRSTTFVLRNHVHWFRSNSLVMPNVFVKGIESVAKALWDNNSVFDIIDRHAKWDHPTRKVVSYKIPGCDLVASHRVENLFGHTIKF